MENIIKYTTPLKLLYVEDNELARESSIFLLENFFENIVVAVDGVDGLKKFKDNDIDIVITDIDMPHLNGLDMIEEIRKIDDEVPSIILSAHMKTEYFIQSIKLSVKGYLIKPVDLDSLVDTLRSVVASIYLDIEVLRNKEIEEQNNVYLQSIIDGVHDQIMVIKEDYSIELMNSYLIEDNVDMDNPNINDMKCYEIAYGRSTPCEGTDYPCPLKEVMQNQKDISVVHSHYNKNNEKSFIELAVTPLFNEKDECVGIIEAARDITSHIDIQLKLREQKDMLYHQAHHDALTGLANRILFDDRLEQAILRAKRSNTKVALFFIDLNKFKQINDTLGHKTGDFILKTVSKNMAKEMRKEDTLARIGGDEFTIIMENINESLDARKVAKKVLDAIEMPIEYEGNSLSVSASIGISIYPSDASSSETLLKYADMSMYKSKQHTDEKILCYSQLKSF